jgi:drug/metabolite transporter (DMT)-like permease
VTVVLFAALAGALFGGLALTVRWGLGRPGVDPEAGALPLMCTAVVVVGIGAAIEGGPVHVGDLWPFVLSGALVPGVSQILFIIAVRDAGPARASILIGVAPLLSVLIALTLLNEPAKWETFVGTVLVVSGGVALARERARPQHWRVLGAVAALICATLFAVRDNLVRWAARDTHPPPWLAATVSLTAAAVVIALYLLIFRRRDLRARLVAAVPAFAPAGVALGLAYGCLLEAFDHGRVSIVAPLNATQSLWAVLLASLFLARHEELIGRRVVIAGLLIVGGGALIGVSR